MAAIHPAAALAIRKPGQHRASIRAEIPATRQGDPGVAILRLYDPIDSWGGPCGISAKEFLTALDDLPEDTSEIRLHINSPGGEVYEGIAILNALRNHPARIVTVVDGIAASAASFIAMAGDEVIMGRNSELMIHNAIGICLGDADDMRDLADRLDKHNSNIASIYADKAGGDVTGWLAAMAAETWYSDAEAVEAGLADRVLSKDEDPQGADTAKNRFDLSVWAHAGRSNAPAPAMPARNRPTPKTPASPGGTTTTPKEGSPAVAFTDEQLTTMRNTLGVDEAADEGTILAALDEALAERADPPPPAAALPSGVVAIDAAQLAELRAAAELGRTAHNRQQTEDRQRVVDAAVADGRIPPARREHWVAALAADPDGNGQALAGLEKGLIPVGPTLGFTGSAEDSAEDLVYATVYGKDA